MGLQAVFGADEPVAPAAAPGVATQMQHRWPRIKVTEAIAALYVTIALACCGWLLLGEYLLRRVLRAGTARANLVAEETLAMAKKAMKQDYFPRKLSVG